MTLAGWMVAVLYPEILPRLGIGATEMWFLDTYAVLAACDAHAVGLPPESPNPFDVIGRPHSYSDWWFALGWLGLGREHNFVVGLAWVFLFMVTALWALRPRNGWQAVAAAALMLSPPVLLAVQRGNNDLVVFALLAVAGGVMRARGRWRLVVANLAIGLATGLKFYPAAASALFLVMPRRRERIAATLVGGMVAALVLGSVWASVSRGFFVIPLDVHKVGAAVWLTDLNLTSPGWKLAAVALVLGAGAVVARGGWFAWQSTDGEANPAGRAWFTLAAAVAVGCFLVGIGHAYRWIILLLIPAWLFASSASTRHGWRGRLSVWILLFAVLWGDGLFCLFINARVFPLSQEEVYEWAKVWRLCSQPMHWLLMILLSGWLWRTGLDALKPDEKSAS